MKRGIQLLVAFLFIPSLVFAQGFQPTDEHLDESNWEYLQHAPPDTSIFAVHGLAFDAEGKLWGADFYGTGEKIVDEDTLSTNEVYCLQPDFETPCDGGPFYEAEHADSTFRFGQMRGMTSDANGDIIASFNGYRVEEVVDDTLRSIHHTDRSFIVRLNHQNGEIMDVFEPENHSWHVDADQEGFVYYSDVVGPQEIHVLDENLDPVTQVTDERQGVARDIGVSNDGTRIYQPSSAGWIYIYESDAGPFGEYAKTDSIAEGSNSAGVSVHPVTDDVYVTIDGIDWGIGVNPEDWDPWGYYVFDPEQDHEIVDQFAWYLGDEERDLDEGSNWPVHRTSAISADGTKFAAGTFGGSGIQVFENDELFAGAEVTFNVDMSEAADFDGETHDVYVAGSFADGWTTPGENPDYMLEAQEEDDMYSLSLMVAEGDHEYKYAFIEDEPSWDNDEWAGDPNREISVIMGEDMEVNDTFGNQGDETVSVDDPAEERETPLSYELEQNYPNPFNPVTNIEFTIPKTESVKLTVYNMLGQQVKVLVDETMQAGTHHVTFDAGGLASGTYIYRLEAGGHQFSNKMQFVK